MGCWNSYEFIISLICAHFFQDLEAWQQGLRFLMGDNDAKTAQAPVPAPETAQLKAQEELNERLQQENQMLREMIKRKDATIAAAGLDLFLILFWRKWRETISDRLI